MITEGVIGEKVEILFVEDNPRDVRLTMETLKDRKVLDDLSAVGLRWGSYKKRIERLILNI